MKRSVFALAVLAVALPSLAFAGEPVPMTDNDLDATVAAGYSLKDLDAALTAIRARPEFFASLVEENSAQIKILTDRYEGLLRRHDARIRASLPAQFHYLLPSSD